MHKDWLFKTDEYICGLRAAGILLRDGRLLVQRERGGSEYALPGGHVRIGETAADALAREFREEAGAEIRCLRLLWTEECFWEWRGRQAHDITFYYLIELCGVSDVPDTGEFIPHRDNAGVLLGWLPADGLADAVIYPEFIRERINDLSGAPEHFVTRA